MYGSVADRLDEKDIKWKKHKRRELVRECQFVSGGDLPTDGARDLTNGCGLGYVLSQTV